MRHWALMLLLLSGCGYHFGQGSLISEYCTISIPFAVGDRDGDLTAALVKEMSRSAPLEYTCGEGDLTLLVTVVDIYDEHVGYRYDRKNDGRLKKSLIPVETRIYAVVDVTVMQTCSGCEVVGPARLKMYVDFDHDYYSVFDDVNVTSLGQLNDIDTARDSVYHPLNRAIAEKVVDYVNAAW